MKSQETPQDKQPLSIPYPPDFVFKNRNKARIAPAQEVMQQQQAMFIFERMDYPESGGQLAYFKDVPYPAKGHPFPEAIYAVNFVKRITRNSILGFINKDLWKEYIGFMLSSKKNKIKKISRFLELYVEIANKVIAPYILEERYFSPCSYEILDFTRKFLARIGIENSLAYNFAEIFASQIEYDNAYRLRIEDAMSETTKELLMADPRKELVRLGQIIAGREPRGGTGDRFPRILGMLSNIFLIPKYKKIFVDCVKESNFENFQLDDADRYHILLWADYNFLGKTQEERVKMYTEIHKNGYPPRIVYTPQ